MKKLFPLIIGGLLLQLSTAVAEVEAPRLYLLEVPKTHQWCTYASQSVWNAAVQKTGSAKVAELTFRGDRMSVISITETDESGDWMVFDRYLLDELGRPYKLFRTLNVLSGDRSVIEAFSLSEDKVTKLSTRSKQLRTGRNVPPSEDVWLPHIPIARRLNMLPFSDLLTRSDLRQAEKICITSSDLKR